MNLRRLKLNTDQKTYFKKLCREIIGQQLAGKAAEAITGRFEKLFTKVGIEPKNILEVKEQDLRNIGMSWAKVRYVRNLAEGVNSGEVNLAGLPKLKDEEVIAELIKVKGVGRWTAEMFLIFTLGREDVFSFGDLGLFRGFKRLYKMTDKQAKRKIKSVTDKWSPYKSYGCLALWEAAEIT